MLRLRCDRCNKYHDNPRLYAATQGPYANSSALLDSHADVHMPSGWQKVSGFHLCESCVRQLDEFLKPLPQAARVAG